MDLKYRSSPFSFILCEEMAAGSPYRMAKLRGIIAPALLKER